MFGKKNEQPGELEIFTIYDSKAQCYDPVPGFAPNKNVIIRDLLNLMRDPQQKANKLLVNAEDYSVFKIGTYNKVTGMVTSQQVEHVANLHDLRAMAGEGALSPT